MGEVVRDKGLVFVRWKAHPCFLPAISLDLETFLNGTIITYLWEKKHSSWAVFHLSFQKCLDEVRRQSLLCQKAMIVYDDSPEFLMILSEELKKMLGNQLFILYVVVDLIYPIISLILYHCLPVGDTRLTTLHLNTKRAKLKKREGMLSSLLPFTKTLRNIYAHI